MHSLLTLASQQRPLKGVNLGGWLVLEPWMTPSLFAGTGAVDEYSFCATADAPRRHALKQFRDTFITRQDFAWLAEQGIQAVRLPVGYWLFGQQGPYLKTYQYVDMVFAWAAEFGMTVLLDLHGAPSSQNGKMHSGRAGALAWDPGATLDVLERLAKHYGQQPSLLGISFLNEPSPAIPRAELEQFYSQAAERVQPHCRPDVWLVFSDQFKPHAWRRRLRGGGLHMDHHQYQLFTIADKYLPVWAQLFRARWWLPRKLRRMARRHPVIIGEWSLVLQNEKRPAVIAKYARYQLRAFQLAAAWFYWNYKTEGGGLWSFRDCAQYIASDIE